MSLGRTITKISLENSNKGTLPAKLPIMDLDQANAGTIFF